MEIMEHAQGVILKVEGHSIKKMVQKRKKYGLHAKFKRLRLRSVTYSFKAS